jgi:hypothetical protein
MTEPHLTHRPFAEHVEEIEGTQRKRLQR